MNEFQDVASKESTRGFVADYIHFIRRNKKWWIIPLLLWMLVLGGLMLLGTTGAGPFIYTLF